MKRSRMYACQSVKAIAMLPLLLFLNLPSQIRARSWWSLEISALEGIRNVDPLHAPSSLLLVEDTSFLYGSSTAGGDYIKSSYTFRPDRPTTQDANEDDRLTVYSTPPPSVTGEAQEQAEDSASPVTAFPITSSPVTPSPSRTGSNIPSIGTSFPTASPTAQPERVGPFPETAFPTTEDGQYQPTFTPSKQPTFTPSKHYEAANGSCPPKHDLFRLWLYDSVGDGWGSTKLVITESSSSSTSNLQDAIFVGSLDKENQVIKYGIGASVPRAHVKDGNSQRRRLRHPRALQGETQHGSINEQGLSVVDPSKMANGNDQPSMADTFRFRDAGIIDGGSSTSSITNGSVYLCLKQEGCHAAKLSGGTFLEEVRWELTRVELGTGENIGLLAEGVGEGTGVCSFSLDGSCEKTCDGEAQTSRPSLSPTTMSPTQSPTALRTDEPTRETINEERAYGSLPTQSPHVFLPNKRTTATASPTVDLFKNNMDALGIEEYRRILDVILESSPSSEDALTDGSSHQFRAFEWMYNNNASGLSNRRLVQRWTLVTFYIATRGDGWVVNTGWMEPTENECEWYGITCLDGVISKVELEHNRLVGEIVPEISAWDQIHVLSLGNDYGVPQKKHNELQMPVPSFMSKLTQLKLLNLQGIGLTSTFPEDFFSSWTQLELLYLNNNDITGTLPTNIKQLRSIKVLRLGGNNLGGPIIPEIGQLVYLKDLSLESNYRDDSAGKRGFTTMLPPEIGQLMNLENLSLADNTLSGAVPMQLGSLRSLRHCNLSGNFFEGQLPKALGRLEMLEVLDVSDNWLSSTIPSEYGGMISLSRLSLHSNYNDEDGFLTWGIKDKIPTEIGNLQNIQQLDLSNNYLTGTLMTEIGQLHLLETLNLENNLLQGPIPIDFSNCVSMKEIRLQENEIDGESFVPEEICNLPGLDLALVDCQVSCECCSGCR